MLKGFYSLTSGMLTHSKKLNVISNNLVNVSTPGYKSDTAVSTTFKDVLLHRIGNLDKSNKTPLGTSSMITIIDDIVTNYDAGALVETNREFDFAILGDGFFNINTEDGLVYSKNGCFSLDDEGYLTLQHIGRVQGNDGDIYLGTDKFNVNQNGDILIDGAVIDTIRLSEFNDTAVLEKVSEGVYSNADADNEIDSTSSIKWKWKENSNVNTADEMAAMMSTQRALQSSAQVLKMYDQLMYRIVNDIGKI